MEHSITTLWTGGMSFKNVIDNHECIVDANIEAGGNDLGPSPKKLLLAGLAGCTGMDVVSILNKMRQPISGLSIKIDALLTEEHPKVYSSINIIYIFNANDNIDKSKVEKAINLSQETYCGVAAMLRKGSEIGFEIRYE